MFNQMTPPGLVSSPSSVKALVFVLFIASPIRKAGWKMASTATASTIKVPSNPTNRFCLNLSYHQHSLSKSEGESNVTGPANP
jgi:hypothetical protein